MVGENRVDYLRRGGDDPEQGLETQAVGRGRDEEGSARAEQGPQATGLPPASEPGQTFRQTMQMSDDREALLLLHLPEGRQDQANCLEVMGVHQ
jgi:hypothetical protein